MEIDDESNVATGIMGEDLSPKEVGTTAVRSQKSLGSLFDQIDLECLNYKS